MYLNLVTDGPEIVECCTVKVEKFNSDIFGENTYTVLL